MDSDLQRFEAKIVRHPGGCWEWTGAKNDGGYGKFRLGRKIVFAHCFSYERFSGPIPDTKVLDHLCRNPSCVNPGHLEPVTQQVNALRGVGITAQNAAKTHCPHGHSYVSENIYRWRGRRICRQCKAASSRRHKALARQARKEVQTA